MQRQAKLPAAENDNFDSQVDQNTRKSNPIIRQNLLPMCTYNEAIKELGLSEETCAELGIGYLSYGRSSLRGRVIMQLRDARQKDQNTKLQQIILSHIGLPNEDHDKYWIYPGFTAGLDLLGQERLRLDKATRQQVFERKTIILIDDPLGLAKAYQYGVRNMISTLGTAPSEEQVVQAVRLAHKNKVQSVKLLLQRGKKNACYDFTRDGVHFTTFDWEQSFKLKNSNRVSIPKNISIVSHFSEDQLLWLQKMALI